MMDLSIPYYEDNTRLSNSAIGWFLKGGPAFFHKKLNGEIPNEDTSALRRGTMIHEYILQPEEFQKDYVVWDKSRPSSAQQEKFCQALASSLEIEPNKAVLEAYKAAYSTRGKSEENMLSEGLKIASTLNDYIEFLKSDDGREKISPWDVKMLQKIKENIQAHKFANKIIRNPEIIDKFGVELYHEFHINWEFKGVKCKSLLDSLEVDFSNRICTISDLKTTQKLWHFEDSMDMYDYARQLMFYKMAATWYLVNERGVDDIDMWSFQYFIVGIDTTGSYEVRVFSITDKQVKSREDVIISTVLAINWHMKNDKWEHSYSYYTGDGAEFLNL